MKLTSKLTILYISLAVIPLGILGYLAQERSRQAIEREALNHLISVNILKSDEVHRWIESTALSLDQLANRPLVREYSGMLANHSMAEPAYGLAHFKVIEDHLKPRLRYGGFFEIFIMCPDQGIVLASTDERQEGKYRDNRQYFIEGKKGTYIQNVYYSNSLERPAITIGAPIKDKNGNLIAVLAGHLEVNELSKMVAQQSGLSQTEDTYLVNTFNFFVTEPRFAKDYALKKSVYTEGVLAGLSGKEGVGFYRDYRGIPVIGAYRWLPAYHMCIITEIDQAEAYGPIGSLRRTVGGIALFTALIAALLVYLFARTLTRPVRQLAEGAKEIGRGNLRYRVAVTSKDEVGELSRAFDHMAEELEKTTVSRDELAKSEERFRATFEQAAVGIAHVSPEGRSLRINRKLCDIVGYSHEELSQRTFQDITHPEDLNADLTHHHQLLRRQIESYVTEKRYIRKDGSIVWVNLTVSLVRAPDGSPLHFISVVKDITLRKQMEEEIRRLNQSLERRVVERTAELEAANKELEAFAYSVSHDLRSPLRGIDGYSKVLMEDYHDKLDGDGRFILGQVRASAQEMGTLIDDLLDFSRMGRRGMREGSVDMTALFRRTFGELRKAQPDRRLELKLDGIPATYGDPSMLQVVVRNLLENAVKFTRPREVGVIEAGVWNGAGGMGNMVVAENTTAYFVKDNGVGFDMKYSGKLFQVFQRLHRAEEFEGTGVGLAIVKRIIDRHGGRVWAEAKAGEGAVIYFALPNKEKENHEGE